MQDPQAVAKIESLRIDSPYSVEIAGELLVLIRDQDGVAVFEGVCPHQGAPLSEGSLKDGRLRCASHGWTFETQTGKLRGNEKICLTKFTSKIENGSIFIDLAEIRQFKTQKVQKTKPTNVKNVEALPGPRGLPFFGIAFAIKIATIHRIFEKWTVQFGKWVQLRLPFKRMVLTCDYATIQELLVDRPHRFRRGSVIQRIFVELKANGLFSSEGTSWLRQRRLTGPAFNSSHLKDFFPTLARVNDRLFDLWNKKAQSGEDIEVQRDLMKYTVDVTTNLAFGYDMNTLQSKGSAIHDHLNKIFPALGYRLNAPFPYWRYIRLKRDRELDRSITEIKKTVIDIVEQSRKRIAENPTLAEHPTNFLEGFLVYKDEQGQSLSDDELFANVITILVAGEDTTANATSWLLHHLVEFPEVQEKARAEVDKVLGNLSSPADSAMLDNLHYLDAVIQESMRFEPVANLVVIEPLEPTEVCGIRLTPKTSVICLIKQCGMLEENFSRPREFLPERWLESGRLPVHNAKASMPFGAGPRFCPGRSLAILNMKMVIATVLKNFTLSKPRNGKRPTDVFNFVVIPEDLWIRFSPR